MNEQTTETSTRTTQVVNFSYKDPDALRRFVTPQGYIVSRERTGLRQKDQRSLAREIKRARHLALLPFTQTL